MLFFYTRLFFVHLVPSHKNQGLPCAYIYIYVHSAYTSCLPSKRLNFNLFFGLVKDNYHFLVVIKRL